MMEEGPRGEGSEKNAFSPRPLPHRFLFQPPFTFRAAATNTASYASSLAPMSECYNDKNFSEGTGLAILSDENPQGTPCPFTGPQGWATAAKTSLLKWIRVFFKRSENFKCRHMYSLELISWGPHSSLERERKIRRRLFTSSIKHKIKHFHVLISHVQSCCFAEKPICLCFLVIGRQN